MTDRDTTFDVEEVQILGCESDRDPLARMYGGTPMFDGNQGAARKVGRNMGLIAEPLVHRDTGRKPLRYQLHRMRTHPDRDPAALKKV